MVAAEAEEVDDTVAAVVAVAKVKRRDFFRSAASLEQRRI